MNSTSKFGAVIRLLFASVVLAMALALLFKAALPVGAGRVFSSIGRSRVSQSQDEEKSLDVERYPDEPLELVDLQIRHNSVKKDIRFKSKDSISRWGRDHVKFKEKDDWFKNVKITLRNVSGRPIYGLSASLFFKPSSLRMLFQMALKQRQLRNLTQQPLQPGDEISLEVNEGSSNEGMQYMIQYGVDANQCTVSLSVDTAYFSDDLGWSKGAFIRRDPNKPKNWKAVDPPEPSPTPSPGAFPAPPEASRLFQPAGFKTISFKPISNPVQFLNYCQAAPGGIIAWACNHNGDDPCDTISQQGNGAAGYLSSFAVPGRCTYNPGPTQTTCDTETINYTLAHDGSCPPPGATPTPMSCLPDGWTYQGGIPCCSGSYDQYNTCGPATPFPSPTPTPLSCIPNWQMTFGTPCCSGYSIDGICQPNPSPTPPPLPCFPNGSLCFLPSACCSGNCDSSFRCAAPGATPTPTCLPDGSFCFDDPQCCSGNCDYLFFDCFSYGGGDPGGGPGGGEEWCYWSDCSCSNDWECDSFCDWDGYCGWAWLDPILIDVKGDGFAMTDAANGVTFDFFGRGVRRKISWTAAGADDAWLVLDRNRNGNIDSAREMFSNVSPQPQPPAGALKIGFVALAEYDKAAHGGNGDGVIDKNDQIFPYLRLWQDANHNGISESTELHSLPALGLESMSLDYKESRRTDRWGNTFRYRAKVYGTNHKDLGRWAFDVVLSTSKRAPGRESIALDDSGPFPLWKIDIFRPSRSQRLGQIDDLSAGKSFLREISRSSSLLW